MAEKGDFFFFFFFFLSILFFEGKFISVSKGRGDFMVKTQKFEGETLY